MGLESAAAIPPADLPDLGITLDFQDCEMTRVRDVLTKDLGLNFSISGPMLQDAPPITLRVERMRARYCVEFLAKLINADVAFSPDGEMTLREFPDPVQAVFPVPAPAPDPNIHKNLLALNLDCHEVTPAQFRDAYIAAFSEPLTCGGFCSADERVSIVVHDANRETALDAGVLEVFGRVDDMTFGAHGVLHLFPQERGLRRVVPIDVTDRPLSELVSQLEALSGLRMRLLHCETLPMPRVTFVAREGIEVSHALDDLAAVFLMWSPSADGGIAIMPIQSQEERMIPILKSRKTAIIPVMTADRIVDVEYRDVTLADVARDLFDRYGLRMMGRHVIEARQITLGLHHRSLSDVLKGIRIAYGADQLKAGCVSGTIVAEGGTVELVVERPQPLPVQLGMNDF